MVLSWRASSSDSPHSNLVFTGTGVFLKFFFLYENLLTREAEEEMKAQELLKNLYGPSFDFYLEIFSEEGVLTPDDKD